MRNLILILLVVFSFPTFAQISLSISAGINPQEISLYDHASSYGDNAYWNNGFTIGIIGDYRLSDHFFVSASFQYSHYNFDRYANTSISIPEIIFRSAEGEDSKIWTSFIEAKYFTSPSSRFKFFIYSGFGLTLEKLGTVKTTFLNMMQGGEVNYTTDSEKNNYLVHSLGLGVRAFILLNIFTEISVSYYSNYSDRFQSTISFRLGYFFN